MPWFPGLVNAVESARKQMRDAGPADPAAQASKKATIIPARSVA
jgi:hypothetical protein